jgi:hypothetical protein
MTGVGLLAGGVEVGLLTLALKEAIDDDKVVKDVMYGSLGVSAIGAAFTIAGRGKIKKAVSLYNESIEVKKSRTSELKIGPAGNGLGLAFTF